MPCGKGKKYKRGKGRKRKVAAALLGLISCGVSASSGGPCHPGELVACPGYCLFVEGSRAELGGGCPAKIQPKEKPDPE